MPPIFGDDPMYSPNAKMNFQIASFCRRTKLSIVCLFVSFSTSDTAAELPSRLSAVVEPLFVLLGFQMPFSRSISASSRPLKKSTTSHRPHRTQNKSVMVSNVKRTLVRNRLTARIVIKSTIELRNSTGIVQRCGL